MQDEEGFKFEGPNAEKLEEVANKAIAAFGEWFNDIAGLVKQDVEDEHLVCIPLACSVLLKSMDEWCKALSVDLEAIDPNQYSRFYAEVTKRKFMLSVLALMDDIQN